MLSKKKSTVCFSLLAVLALQPLSSAFADVTIGGSSQLNGGFRATVPTTLQVNDSTVMQGNIQILNAFDLSADSTAIGSSFVNAIVTLAPTTSGPTINLGGVKIGKLVIGNSNVQEVRGADQVQLVEFGSGVNPVDVRFFDQSGNQISPPGTPPTLSITKQTDTLYINSGRDGTTAGDVLLMADSIAVIGYQYDKQRVKNFIQVKRGAETEELQYAGDTNYNVVYVSHDTRVETKVGEVRVESSDADVTLRPGSNGVMVHPEDSATEDTSVSLIFHLWERGTEVGSVTLPITMDETAPTVSTTTYSNQILTLTATEPIYREGATPQVDIEYSEQGNFSDGQVLTIGADYQEPTINGNVLQIVITKNLTPGSTLRINNIRGIYDRADNPLGMSVQPIIVVP